ncbi:MAG: SUMF1/EgtB/PvdO family nonheme iron enzyme [bacterium]
MACAGLVLGALAGCEGETAGAFDVGLPPLADFEVLDQQPRCVPRDERCNGADDDCDGVADEAAGVQAQVFSDVEHCGACGRACAGDNATFACRVGTCVVTGCTPGFGDYNGDPDDGCETDCVITAGGREDCDGRDNDCDGVIDEGFDTASDMLHCGGCGRACPALPQASPRCVEGGCRVETCESGFVDLDGLAENGCEYACAPRGGDGPGEVCNGADDDCDGRVDEAADRMPPPDTCGASGVCARECDETGGCDGTDRCLDGICVPSEVPDMPCETDAACQRVHPGLACLADGRLEAGAVVITRRCQPRGHGPVCDGPAGYRCVRPLVFSPGDEFGACDAIDNDCDGRVDEDYAASLLLDDRVTPRPCSVGIGACARPGVVRCAADGRGTTCAAVAGRPERNDDPDCDGVDDDCDGELDEDHIDDWVRVAGFEIYAYEASRPGSTRVTPGIRVDPQDPAAGFREARACSQANVLPWTDVTWEEAAAACAAAGARLCSGAEWQRACGGAVGDPFPYGNVYDGQRCNGGAFDGDAMTPGDQDVARPTGSLLGCARAGVSDLSGNVKEWTTEALDELRVVRGGSYETNLAAGLRCDQAGDLKDPALRHPGIGFRCCR